MSDLAENLAERYRVLSTAAFVRSLEDVEPLEIAKFVHNICQLDASPEVLLARSDFRPHLKSMVQLAWTGSYKWTARVPLRQIVFDWISLRSKAFSKQRILFADAMALQEVGDSLQGGGLRAQFYIKLLDTLRDNKPGQGNIDSSGLSSLLVAGAKACYEARDCIQSYKMAVDAWDLRDRVAPTGNSVQTAAYAAIRAAAALGYLERGEFHKNYGRVVAMLAEAGEQVERYEDAFHGTVHLRIASAECQVWSLAAKRGHVGGLAAAYERVISADRAFLACARLRIIPDFNELQEGIAVLSSDLRPDFKGALAKVISFHASSLVMLGEIEQAKKSLSVLKPIPMSTIHSWDMQIETVRIIKNLDDVTQLLEKVIRSEANGEMVDFNGTQRARLYKRFASLATEHSQALRTVQLPTSADFWRQTAKRWRAEAITYRTPAEVSYSDTLTDEDELIAVAEPEGDRSFDDFSRSGTTDDLDMLREQISRENPLAVALQLWRLVSKVNGVLSSDQQEKWRRVAETADGWRPNNRKFREKAAISGLVDGADYKKFFLEVMDEFAQSYAPQLRPECLIRLAKLPNVSTVDKLELSRESARVALALGRRSQALAGMVEAAFAGLELSDEELIREEIGKIVDVGQYALTHTASAADLIETAKSVSGRLQDLAQALIDAQFYELGFYSLHISYGWLSTFFKERSELLEEFQLVEQAARGEAGFTGALLEKMLKRILSDSPPTMFDLDFSHFGSILTPTDGSALIQLLPGKKKTHLVGTLCPTGGVPKYFGGSFDLGERQIRALSDRVWTELRPNRIGKPVPALEQLHSDVMDPILMELQKQSGVKAPPFGMEKITFVPHGAAASLPLHAASGDDGFLIELVKVGYRSAYDPKDSEGNGQDFGSLVGGWDPSIHADLEARDIARLLRRSGYTVDYPKTVRAGEEKLLDREYRVEILHLAAHGYFQPWPRSLNSSIQLSKTLVVSAADWLHRGCQASFVFLNACNIGRVDAGDLNGFPLAVRLRGATAVVAARAYIGPEDARRFAADFYSFFTSSDSLTAFQATVIAAIADERHPTAWVPFIHDGAEFVGSKPLNRHVDSFSGQANPSQSGQAIRRNNASYRGARKRRHRNG